MASDNFDFLTDQNTLWAVVLGALLATIGGFAATQIERHIDRRERERNAALFFGEVLSTLSIILTFAQERRGIGEPYGPVTMRMLRTAKREIDIYDRNRETLYDLRHAELRARIQTLVIRLTMALEGLIEAAPEIAGLTAAVKSAQGAERAEAEARLGEFHANRDGGFEFVMETSQQLKSVIRDLQPLARHSFDRLDQVARSF
jgi:hypothetical protein